jgi:hypothetical protein
MKIARIYHRQSESARRHVVGGWGDILGEGNWQAQVV